MADITLDPSLPPVVEFRSLKPYDRREVKDLYARRVGHGIENTLDRVFDSDASVEGIAATKGETVIGFAVLMILEAEGVAKYFQESTDGYPIGDLNAVFHALAVEKDWEGRGIGSELTRHRLILARDVVGVDAAFGNAWLRPHTVDTSVIFEKYGFERLETIEQSFQSSPGERDCPDCAPDTCKCSSAVYAKTFEENYSQ